MIIQGIEQNEVDNLVIVPNFEQNNTYKNNQIDNVVRAGGLAWLGYRLDMAGITCSNHVRPTINFKVWLMVLKIFDKIW